MMLLGTGIIGGVRPASVLYADGFGTTSNASSYTFNGRATGTEDSSRILILWLLYGFVLSGSVSSVTVGGSAMNAQAAPLSGSGIYTLPWPTGTTANFVVTGSSTFTSIAAHVFAAYDLKSETIRASNGAAFGGSPRSTSFNVMKNGIAIGITAGPTNGTYGWTGLTKSSEFTYNPGNVVETSAACGAFASAQSPLAISTTYGGNHSCQGASFR